MEKNLNEWTHKELMSLPCRNWNAESVYDSVLVVSTRKKHDSGWAGMAIIGVNKLVPVEIASSFSDDIQWKFPNITNIQQYTISKVHNDCAFKSGAMHFWSMKNKFKVGCALSSITIEIL